MERVYDIQQSDYENPTQSSISLHLTWSSSSFTAIPPDYADAVVVRISFHIYDIHRAVHCNIISIVKPTRCTNVSNLFYFGMTLYMFRTVFPSAIRSSRLYLQQKAFVKQIMLSAC